MPSLLVEPGTTELVVTVSSAREPAWLVTLISPSRAAYAPLRASAAAAVFQVPAPEAGIWSFGLSDPNLPAPLPDEPPSVLVEQSVRSRTALRVWLEPLRPRRLPDEVSLADRFRVGSELAIRALCFDAGPATAVTGEATVRRSDGTEWTLELRDDGLHQDGEAGDGMLGARFSRTAAAGAYRVTVRVGGSASSPGGSFERELETAFALAESDDFDADSLADWWEREEAGRLDRLASGDDYDHDGVADEAELWARTGALRDDSDRGGEADGSELARGADPLDPGDDVVSPPRAAVRPGNGKVLVGLMRARVGEEVDIERAATRAGPWGSLLRAPAPGGSALALEAENGTELCVRVRSRTPLAAGATAVSAWSFPECVRPGPDPAAPLLTLELVRAELGVGEWLVTLRLRASDLDPRGDFSAFCGRHGASPTGLCASLVDPAIEASDVVEMILSPRADLAGASWQPFERETTLALADEPPATVYGKVRDAAGNESQEAFVLVPTVRYWPADTVVGFEQVTLGTGSVVAGNVAVTEPEDAQPVSPAEARLGPMATLDGSLRASRARLLPGSQVSGDAWVDELSGDGALLGTVHTPLETPLLLALPTLEPAAAGPDELLVRHGETVHLDAGSYGALRAQSSTSEGTTRLVLAGGRYTLGSLELGAGARLECEARCELQLAGALELGAASYLGPGATGAPASLELLVGGRDGKPDDAHYGEPGAEPAAARAGPAANLSARLFVPHGSIRIGPAASVQGKLIGRRVHLGAGAAVADVQ
jgi:hypothetical protein